MSVDFPSTLVVFMSLILGDLYLSCVTSTNTFTIVPHSTIASLSYEIRKRERKEERKDTHS